MRHHSFGISSVEHAECKHNKKGRRLSIEEKQADEMNKFITIPVRIYDSTGVSEAQPRLSSFRLRETIRLHACHSNKEGGNPTKSVKE